MRGTESFEGSSKGIEKNYDFSKRVRNSNRADGSGFPDSSHSNEINLSIYTANQLNIKVSDKVIVYAFSRMARRSPDP
jgi:hypothetical protein